MEIVRADIYGVRLSFKQPFVIAYDSYESMPSIIVKLVTKDELVGFGEAVPDEHVTGETWESTRQVLKNQLLPSIVGCSPFNIETIHHLMDQTVIGVPAAKAALDIACYDLMGKITGQPICNLIGGKFWKELEIPYVISIGDPATNAEEARWAVENGYRALKLKIGTNVDKGLQCIEAVRKAAGDKIRLRVDVNQGWKNAPDTISALDQVKLFRLDWLEQPTVAHDIDALAEVKRQTTIPIMVDEGLHHPYQLKEIMNKRAADKINIKLMKCGGIYPALKLISQAEMAGYDCQIGSMVESSVASSAGLHLASARQSIKSSELVGPLMFREDIGDLSYSVPFAHLPEKPGLGITVDASRLTGLTEWNDQVMKPSRS